MTLEQLLADVTRVAETMLDIQPQHGVIELKFHMVKAQPDAIAEQLAAALPDWPAPEITAVPAEEASRGRAAAWIEVEHQNIRIVAFIAEKQVAEFLAERASAKAA